MSNDTIRLIVVVKRDCPTCHLIVPVLRQLATGDVPLSVYSQDDPSFPEGLDVIDDTALDESYRAGTVIVPTLIRRQDGQEVDARSAGIATSGSGCLA